MHSVGFDHVDSFLNLGAQACIQRNRARRAGDDRQEAGLGHCKEDEIGNRHQARVHSHEGTPGGTTTALSNLISFCAANTFGTSSGLPGALLIALASDCDFQLIDGLSVA